MKSLQKLIEPTDFLPLLMKSIVSDNDINLDSLPIKKVVLGMQVLITNTA